MASRNTEYIKNLHEIFKRFDHDHDGSLTQLELAALLRSLGLKPEGDKLYGLLSNMDANGNGSIEFNELVEAISSQMDADNLINQEQLAEVFRSFDKDGNGFISATELAKAMTKMGQPMTYKELTAVMNEADANKDGMISFAEFAEIMGRSAAEFFDLR